MKDNYFEEIQNYYLKLKKTSLNISPKETEIIQNWYKNNIPVQLIKKLIKQELTKYSPQRRKRFNLFIVDKKLKELKKSKPKVLKASPVPQPQSEPIVEQSLNDWFNFYKKNNISLEIFKKIKDLSYDEKVLALEKFAVAYLWKKMPEERKKEIYSKVLRKAKIEFNKPDKDLIKKLIKIQIKKQYNFPE